MWGVGVTLCAWCTCGYGDMWGVGIMVTCSCRYGICGTGDIMWCSCVYWR